MKNSFILLFLSCSLVVCGQKNDSIQALLNKIVAHAEQASLYRKNVAWDSLKQKIGLLAKDASSVSELSPALGHLLESLGDAHGRIFHQNQIIAYYAGSFKAHHNTFDPAIYNRVQSAHAYPFEARLLQKDIGYIRIVGMPMGDNTAMAKAIQDEVCQLMSDGAKKWIIDLRYNGGGNMFPMVEGIAAIIGDGMVGGTEGLTTEESAVWQIKDGDFFYADYSVALENECAAKSFPKVAVLTSVYTASSGEALAVILKGRKNTRFFGEKTLGLVTVTDWAVMDESTAMSISVSYYKDRQAQVYKEYVPVDVQVPFAEKPLAEEDQGVKKAILWLEKK